MLVLHATRSADIPSPAVPQVYDAEVRLFSAGWGAGQTKTKHRLLVRLEAPDDIEAFEMHDLDYDDLQTAVNRIRARFAEKDDHVWDFPGGVMRASGMVR